MADTCYLASLHPRRLVDYGLYLLFIVACYPLAAKPDSLEKDEYALTIPAQPLGPALEKFSQETGLAVLLDSRYAGMPSPGLMGTYSPDKALGYLLRNTGLRARWYGSSQAYGIVADTAANNNAPSTTTSIAGVMSKDTNYFAYVGFLQKRLLVRLCRSDLTRQGHYRLAMQLWIGGHGEISRAHMLSSTGNAQRDAEILQMMQGFRLGLIPAREMPQPVTILLQTDPANGVRVCADPL